MILMMRTKDGKEIGPPALWNKDPDIEKAWGIMQKEVDEELEGIFR